MTEYWKSIPKKYCDACKCWFQDNKASIDFHERGTRHKANIQQKIHDSQAKGKTNKVAKNASDVDMEKIEAAAMAAYAKDIAADPALVKTYGAMPTLKKPGHSSNTNSLLESIPLASSYRPDPKPSDIKLVIGQEKILEAVTTKQRKLAQAAAARKWKETKAGDGFSYFHNADTGETRWDAPPEGYVSLSEQSEAEGKSSEEPIPALRTKPIRPASGIPGAVGGWTTVTPRVSTLPDLGLMPASRSAASDLANEMHSTATEQEVAGIQFKTKTVGTFGLGDGQESAFKKRKIGGGDAKRQVRSREE